jgi:hypothetical protein
MDQIFLRAQVINFIFSFSISLKIRRYVSLNQLSTLCNKMSGKPGASIIDRRSRPVLADIVLIAV